MRYLRHLGKKGVSASQQNELENYLRDCHPLLANFGRLGREMAQQIEERGSIAKEAYVLPLGVAQNETYYPLLDPDTKISGSENSMTLLESYPSRYASFEESSKGVKIAFDKFDKSVQVHAAPTRLREVQALHDILLNIIDFHSESNNPIMPSDVIVMAPDIVEYEPFIKMVFVQSETKLDAQIMDLHLSTQSLFVQGFLHLLSLPYTRWDAESLLQLFRYLPFQRKQKFRPEDLRLIEKWVKETGINRGQHSSHRDEMLQRSHCMQGMVDDSPSGTWEFGMERLLTGLVLDSAIEMETFAPPYEIDFSQGELLGKVVFLIRTLHQDLRPLGEGSLKTLLEWAEYLNSLLDKYYEASLEEKEERNHLVHAIALLSQLAGVLPDASYSFISIKKHLETALSKKRLLIEIPIFPPSAFVLFCL